jgi:hypothetical protein
MSVRRGRAALAGRAAAVLSILLFTACTGAADKARPAPSRGPATLSSSSHSVPSTPVSRSGHAPIYAIYYMWWDRRHWLSRLGRNYPSSSIPSPLPASLDASGCGTINRFDGNVETDISQGLAYDQANSQTIIDDVETAAAAGLNGFLVNWIGTGEVNQTQSSSNYNIRLAAMFAAVHRINATGKHFSLILNYQSSAKMLPLSQFTNDFQYFLANYQHDPALDHTYSAKPEVVMAGTWKYNDSDVAAISAQFRSHFYLIGDEKPASWDKARADNLDGTSYYWSSQNPERNQSSFATLKAFAATVRSSRNPDGSAKTWLAPFTPGYNATLLYHTPTCVPRNNGQTMHALFTGNSASAPDGWTFISWNEISEGSYVVPLTRYGTTYIHVLATITGSGR